MWRSLYAPLVLRIVVMENELCNRIIHNGDWQKKVLEEISNTPENDQKDVIKKILQNCEIK